MIGPLMTEDGRRIVLENGMRVELAPLPSVFFGRRGTGAMYGKKGAMLRLAMLINAGCSLREAARKTPCSKATATKMRAILRSQRERRGMADITCGCGAPAVSHRGWCSFRFKQSEARQRVVARMRRGKRSGVPPSVVLAVDRSRSTPAPAKA